MTDTNRRVFLGGLAVAASGLAATQSLAAGNDDGLDGRDLEATNDCYRKSFFTCVSPNVASGRGSQTARPYLRG
jgi:hypothetical protein